MPRDPSKFQCYCFYLQIALPWFLGKTFPLFCSGLFFLGLFIGQACLYFLFCYLTTVSLLSEGKKVTRALVQDFVHLHSIFFLFFLFAAAIFLQAKVDDILGLAQDQQSHQTAAQVSHNAVCYKKLRVVFILHLPAVMDLFHCDMLFLN